MKLIIFIILSVEKCLSIDPNILMIVLDDFKPALQSYGCSQAFTPNMDELVSKSFVFKHAYAQQALCAPSRNSFLTSRRPDTLRLYDFYSYWRTSVGNFTTLPQYFKEHGYFTKSIGKIFHPGISSNFSDDQPYSWSTKPFHPHTQRYKNAKVCNSNDGTKENNLICPVIPEFQPGGTLPDIESAEEAIKFLQNTRGLVQPYLLAVGFHKPHIPLKFPEKYLEYHPLNNVSLPKNIHRPPSLPTVVWNPWTDVRKRYDIKTLNVSFPFGPMPTDTTKMIIQAYHASLTYIDDLIGKILKEVDLENSIVVLTSDHGWSFGEHGEFSKFSNYLTATRVPLIIHAPQLSNRQVNINSLAEMVDLFPTLVDLAKISNPLPSCLKEKSVIIIDACTEGNSLVSVMKNALENREDGGKHFAFTQYPRPGIYPTLHPNSDKPYLKDITIMGYSIISDRYRFCQWVGFNSTTFNIDFKKVYAEELYDHLIDPDEDLNLVDRFQLQSIVKYFRRHLHKAIKGPQKDSDFDFPSS